MVREENGKYHFSAEDDLLYFLFNDNYYSEFRFE